ncbi:DUF3108 domain-containing protein [Caldithrix abyssi]
MRRFIIAILLWGQFFVVQKYAAAGEIPPFRWQVGERLTWKVSWSFIRLGTLQMIVEDTVRIKNQKLYRIKLLMDSNPVLIFVNIHNKYECLIDSLFRPVIYLVNENESGNKNILLYQFDYDKRQALMQVLDVNDSTHVLDEKIINLEHNLYDGISLTFFARGNASPNKTFELYTFINDRTGPLDMRFGSEVEEVKIRSVGKELPTIRVEGTFHIKGIAGVTGDYKGWFTRDERRVPLKALLKVFVGNVVVELESWKNWHYE